MRSHRENNFHFPKSMVYMPGLIFKLTTCYLYKRKTDTSDLGEKNNKTLRKY